jgi:hypothetical protein
MPIADAFNFDRLWIHVAHTYDWVISASIVLAKSTSSHCHPSHQNHDDFKGAKVEPFGPASRALIFSRNAQHAEGRELVLV